MKISSDEIIIDLRISDSDSYETGALNNLEQLIHLLKCSFRAIAHSQSPSLVFRRKGDADFECWIEADERGGVYLSPQIPTITTTAPGELDPYRSVSCLIMNRLRRWSKEHPKGEFLEIPIHF